MIQYLDSTLFDWLTWRSGNVCDILGLSLRCRTEDIISYCGKERILSKLVGYCPAERLACRPKKNHTALMFFVNGHHFWFHLRNEEWKEIMKGYYGPANA